MSSPSGFTGHLIFATAAAALGGASQHGYNIGVVNAPQQLVSDWISQTIFARTGTVPDKGNLDFIYASIVAIYGVGGLVGALMTAYISGRFGRKGGLLLNNLFVFIGGPLMGFSRSSSSYEMLIAGRFFMGINSGLNAGLAPMYLSEISPANLRGAIGTVYQLVVVFTILISNILGIPQLLGTAERWPILFGITVVPAIFMLATLPFCPESPKFMLIFQGKEREAQNAFSWLRGTPDVKEEMDEVRTEAAALKLMPKVTLGQLWSNNALRQPMIISVVIMLSQQLSGINAAIFYSTQIFANAGLTTSQALYSTLGMGVVNLIMTIISLFLIEKTGRRTLHMVGLSGMATMTVVLTLCLSLRDITVFRYISIVSVIVFVVFFATGPGSIPWFLVAELFGAGARGLAVTIAVAVNWAANIAVGLTFLPLANLLGDSVFLIYTFFLIIFWVYTYRRVPETKGKTTEEVSSYFEQEKQISSSRL